jgi:ABC-type multidrug transport system ATPase subunit
LDEPYTGLDGQAANMLDSVLHDAGAGSRTVILTTHNLERGLRAGRRVVILVKGSIVYEMDDEDRDLDRLRQAYEVRAAGAR